MTARARSSVAQNWKTLFLVLTMVLDGAVLIVSLFVGYLINFPQSIPSTFLTQQWKLVTFSVVLYLFLSAMFGVYRQAYNSSFRVQLVAALKAYVIGTLVIFATLFLFRNTYYQQGVLITFGIVVPVLFLVFRSFWAWWRSVLHRRRFALETAIVVLADTDGEMYARQIVEHPSIGYDVQLMLRMSQIEDITKTLERIDAAVRETGEARVLFTGGSLEGLGNFAVMDSIAARGWPVRIVTPEVHDTLARMRLYDLAGIAYAPASRNTPKRWEWSLKRLFDMAASLLIMVLLLPLAAVIGLMITLESPGGVLFRQMRALSLTTQPIRVYKFRSMKKNAELEKEPVPEDPVTPDVLFKVHDDPRVTRVGRFIRKFSIDELPQLINVVKGEMSLVGPRPLPVEDFHRLSPQDPAYRLSERRHTAKPGMTGLWQISGRSTLTFQEMVLLDLYYAENQTLLFDLEILLQTLPAVLSSRGAY